jgi:hypothetical protein
MSDLNVFRGYGVVVTLPHTKTPEQFADLSPEQKKETLKDSFLKVRETLTRIGVASRKEKNLYQSCHLLHKRGQYAILHFKELFLMDGKGSNIDDEDIARRNRIVKLLEEWELLKPVSPVDNLAPLNHIKIIKHSEKHEWSLTPKYSVGARKK